MSMIAYDSRIISRRDHASFDRIKPTILGVVTTGSNWKFLTLEQTKFSIDFDEYMIVQVNKIMGIFIEGIHQ